MKVFFYRDVSRSVSNKRRTLPVKKAGKAGTFSVRSNDSFISACDEFVNLCEVEFKVLLFLPSYNYRNRLTYKLKLSDSIIMRNELNLFKLRFLTTRSQPQQNSLL